MWNAGLRVCNYARMTKRDLKMLERRLASFNSEENIDVSKCTGKKYIYSEEVERRDKTNEVVQLILVIDLPMQFLHAYIF